MRSGTDGFDELTRAVGRARTRREALVLLAKGAFGVAVGSATSLTFESSSVAAETCVVEYPVGDLNDCPNKRPHPGFVPSVNGCGSQQATVDLVPDGAMGIDFTPGCNAHDECYQVCGGPKPPCDKALGDFIRGRCLEEYDPREHPFRAGSCYRIAQTYEDAVSSTDAAQEAYDAGQKSACECCREPQSDKLWCGCNETCYDQADIALCLQECENTLGCVGQIQCGPATLEQCPN